MISLYNIHFDEFWSNLWQGRCLFPLLIQSKSGSNFKMFLFNSPCFDILSSLLLLLSLLIIIIIIILLSIMFVLDHKSSNTYWLYIYIIHTCTYSTTINITIYTVKSVGSATSVMSGRILPWWFAVPLRMPPRWRRWWPPRSVWRGPWLFLGGSHGDILGI